MIRCESQVVFLKNKAVQLGQTIAVVFLTLTLCFSVPQTYAGGTRTSNSTDFFGVFNTETSQGGKFNLFMQIQGNTVSGNFINRNPLYNGTIRGDLQTQPDGTLALLYITYQPGLKGKDRKGSGVMQMYTDRSFKAEHAFSNAGVTGRIDWTGKADRSGVNIHDIYGD